MKINRAQLNQFIMCVAILVLPISHSTAVGDIVLLATSTVTYVLFSMETKAQLTEIRVNKVYESIFKAGILNLVVLMILFLVNNRGISDAVRIVQFICCMIFLFSAVHHEWSANDIEVIKACFKSVLLLSLLLWIADGFSTYFSSIYSHANTLGGFSFFGLIMFTLPFGKRKKIDLLFSCIAFIMMYASMSRSALVAAMAYIMVLLLGSRMKKINFFFWVVGIATAFFVIWFTIAYPMLYGTELGTILELLSRKYLHKNFFSGRHILWRNILYAMEGKEVLGYGLSMVPEYLYNTNFSSHNLYLQIYLQGGLVGLSSFLLVIVSIFLNIIHGKNRKYIVYGFGFIVAVCVRECFEVSLTQNQLSIGALAWLLFGLFIRLGNYEMKE